MIVEAAKRVFKLDKVELPDPDPKMSVDEVRKFYSGQYPEITTATLGDTNFEGDVVTYTFTQSVGQFG